MTTTIEEATQERFDPTEIKKELGLDPWTPWRIRRIDVNYGVAPWATVLVVKGGR